MNKKILLFIYESIPPSETQDKLLDTIMENVRQGHECLSLLPKKGELSNYLDKLGVKTIFFPIGNYTPINYAIRFPLLTLLLLDLLRREHVDTAYIDNIKPGSWIKISSLLRKIPIITLK